MSLVLLVYLADIVEGLSIMFGMFGFLAGCLGIISVLSVFYTYTYSGEEDLLPVMKKATKWCLVLCLVFSFISTVIPNKSTMYLMAGAYVATAEDSQGNSYLSKVGTIIDGKLDAIVNELDSAKDK